MISSECLRAASKPSLKSFLYMSHPGLSIPPMMSTYSCKSKKEEAGQSKVSTVQEMRRAAHHRQLERRGLEAHVARTVGQHETEVDVEEVTVSVDEDVSVVSVLDLEEVGGDRVAGERLDEVSLGTLVLSG